MDFRFFFGNQNWGILFIDKNPLWKTFFSWLNAMMFTKFTNLNYRSPFKWKEKLQCEWRNSVFLIITGCGKSQFEFFFARNMLFLFPEPTKGTRTNTNLYVSKLTTVPKTKEMSQQLRVSLLKSLLDVFWDVVGTKSASIHWNHKTGRQKTTESLVLLYWRSNDKLLAKAFTTQILNFCVYISQPSTTK